MKDVLVQLNKKSIATEHTISTGLYKVLVVVAAVVNSATGLRPMITVIQNNESKQ